MAMETGPSVGIFKKSKYCAIEVGKRLEKNYHDNSLARRDNERKSIRDIFAFIRKSYAFIRERIPYALYRESNSCIHEQFILKLTKQSSFGFDNNETLILFII